MFRIVNKFFSSLLVFSLLYSFCPELRAGEKTDCSKHPTLAEETAGAEPIGQKKLSTLSKCVAPFVSVAKTLHWTGSTLLFPAYFCSKIFCYYGPLFLLDATYKGLVNREKSLFGKRLLRSLTKDTLRATFFFTFYLTTGKTPSQIYLEHITTPVETIHTEVKEQIPKGTFLGLNANLGLPPYYLLRHDPYSDVLTGKPFEGTPGVFHERVHDASGWIRSLGRTYTQGGSIQTMAIDSHGEPGVFMIGQTPINKNWLENNRKLLESLPKDLFGPNAVIVHYTCRGSETKESVAFYKELYSLILKQGGTVILSTRMQYKKSIIGARYQDSTWRRLSFGEVFHLSISAQQSFHWFQSDYKWNKITRLEIPPREAVHSSDSPNAPNR